jgi:uncharacterized membrane protein
MLVIVLVFNILKIFNNPIYNLIVKAFLRFSSVSNWISKALITLLALNIIRIIYNLFSRRSC